MTKRRRILLLALPLLLGALLGGAKWKQMHPTLTQRDLQERAYLEKAVKVEILGTTRRGEIPIGEFKKALDDFYLLDANANPVRAASTASKAPRFMLMPLKEVVGGRRGELYTMAMIGVASPGTYFSWDGYILGQTLARYSLHPVTQRRLEELVARYRSAK